MMDVIPLHSSTFNHPNHLLPPGSPSRVTLLGRLTADGGKAMAFKRVGPRSEKLSLDMGKLELFVAFAFLEER